MGFIWLIIVGAAAGFLATRLMKIEADIVTTVAIGIGGALIGGFLLRTLLVTMELVGGLVGAVIGSLALIWIWKTYIKK